ncbi:aldolase/citrate lyase family protein [uncultured Propionibacterium sp.]|uniref:aldolase/citrate lyase family protein n=1 Tax=uncultured Propionibacterium sp. TaxID=218066 RepID=UPI0029318AC3|nr:aldolase/citrate lyase family protein [uncultured Propionibacterium sp.]
MDTSTTTGPEGVPRNGLKERLLAGREPQLGLWLSSGSSGMAEIAAGARFDWGLVDGEHGPNSIVSILTQLRAIEPYGMTPVVRPAEASRVLVKQVLDVGAQCLLLPMIGTPEEAAEAVAATRYPPRGVRGVGASIARAGRWGRIGNYMAEAEEQLCVILQVETREGLSRIDEVLRVEGVDGVFIGPADLGASLGGPAADELEAIVCECLRKIRGAGLVAGSIALEEGTARRYSAAGANLLAVASDTDLFVRALDDCLARFGRWPGSSYDGSS